MLVCMGLLPRTRYVLGVAAKGWGCLSSLALLADALLSFVLLWKGRLHSYNLVVARVAESLLRG